jgi:hypothetical protein
MKEIKFACPHCSQHIACDEGYCGYQIRCPSCEGALLVPRLAAFGFGAAANLSVALPVGTPVPRQAAEAYSQAAATWSEREWNRRVAESEGLSGYEAWRRMILWLLFLAPALLALLLANSMSGQGGGASRGQWLWTAWLIFTPICSLLCAAGLSLSMSQSVPVRILITILMAPLIWGLNASISLFLGCVGGLMAAAAKSG